MRHRTLKAHKFNWSRYSLILIVSRTLCRAKLMHSSSYCSIWEAAIQQNCSALSWCVVLCYVCTTGSGPTYCVRTMYECIYIYVFSYWMKPVGQTHVMHVFVTNLTNICHTYYIESTFSSQVVMGCLQGGSILVDCSGIDVSTVRKQ